MECGQITYEKLAEHLNKLPGGFRPSSTGAHIRLLKVLFTEEEAKLATKLTLKRKTAKEIAQIASLSETSTETLLEKMVKKGLIFSSQPEKGTTLYQVMPWVIGIYEFQIKNFTDEFREAVNEYYGTQVPREKPWEPQLRTIPIGKSIEPTLEILSYEQVEKLVEEHDTFAVAPCICRTHARANGGGCDAPLETCLCFGEFADYYVKIADAEYITKEEVKNKIAEANKANLVLNPTNSKRAAIICCCCGCCCNILNNLKLYPKPAEVISSSFRAEYDSDACIGCGVCVDRCQMDAITSVDAKVSLNTDRCIGCGLCVSTCPTNALKLVRKPDSTQQEISATFFDTWYRMTEEPSIKK